MDAGGELAAAPYVLERPPAPPLVVMVTRDLARGAAARAVTRSLTPDQRLLADPLPNVISMAPKKDATTR